jgi:ElaB/YqjD/DUF883 family membrane-anchored ribosome-binding protein
MMENTRASSAVLADELRNVVRQAEALLQAVAADKDEAVEALRARVHSAVDTAKVRLADIEQQAQLASQRASIATEAYVRERPFTVVAGALAAGLILGSFFTRSLQR